MNPTISQWQAAAARDFPGVERLDYSSPADGTNDWALAWPSGKAEDWVVHLHGHGSTGDQIFTRVDIRDAWLTRYREMELGVLSANIRGNSWMAPEAADDLHALLDFCRKHYGIRRFHFVSGSMGGTSNLAYASRFPQDVSTVVALCPATDVGRYHQWCKDHPGGVRDEIRLAIETAYLGTPAETPDRYALQSACAHSERLTMPVFISHGTSDDLIPISESRAFSTRMAGKPSFCYREMEGGHHDSPLYDTRMLGWLEEQVMIPRYPGSCCDRDAQEAG